MNLAKIVKKFAVVLTVVGIVLPRIVVAEQVTRPSNTTVSDVALAKSGTLRGQVVDTDGQPIHGSKVEIRTGIQLIATSTTNDRGEFVVTGLRGGVYHLSTAQGETTVRAWAEGTAPPATQQGILVVDGDSTVRGSSFLISPWLLGGIAILAITLPLVLDDNDNAS